MSIWFHVRSEYAYYCSIICSMWGNSWYLLHSTHYLLNTYGCCYIAIFSSLHSESGSGKLQIEKEYDLDFGFWAGVWTSCDISAWSPVVRRCQRTRGVFHYSLCWYLWEDWHENMYLWDSTTGGKFVFKYKITFSDKFKIRFWLKTVWQCLWMPSCTTARSKLNPARNTARSDTLNHKFGTFLGGKIWHFLGPKICIWSSMVNIGWWNFQPRPTHIWTVSKWTPGDGFFILTTNLHR